MFLKNVLLMPYTINSLKHSVIMKAAAKNKLFKDHEHLEFFCHDFSLFLLQWNFGSGRFGTLENFVSAEQRIVFATSKYISYYISIP